jgi:hypothetical protein
MTTPPTGWPFLIAAGRHRDYSILLAPDFLVQDLDYGFLDETVKPGDGQPRVVNVRTQAGRHLTVVSAAHTLTPADATATHDEHGRPMRLLYGFVSGHRIVDSDPADLAAALTIVLHVYRLFLENEDAPVVMAGQPFALRSTVIRQLEPISARTPASAVSDASQRPTRVTVSIVGAVVATAIALVLWLRPQTGGGEPCPTPTLNSTPCATTPAGVRGER